ncbi:protein YebF [Dryocola sp. LX212]
MNKTGITLCTALCLSSFLAAAADPHKVKITPCEGLDADGIANVIKGDYQQNRIVSWPDDRKKLGQADPVAWVNSKEVTGKNDQWKVPLTIRGMNTDIHYTVLVDCKKGTADYQR